MVKKYLKTTNQQRERLITMVEQSANLSIRKAAQIVGIKYSNAKKIFKHHKA